jgi:hypothetical protein
MYKVFKTDFLTLGLFGDIFKEYTGLLKSYLVDKIMKTPILVSLFLTTAFSALIVGSASASGGPQPLCFAAHPGDSSFQVPWELTLEQEKMLDSKEYTKDGYYQFLAKIAIGNKLTQCLAEGKILNGFTAEYSSNMSINPQVVYSSNRRWFSINKPGRNGSKLFIEGTVVAKTMFFPVTGYHVMTTFKDTTGLPASAR